MIEVKILDKWYPMSLEQAKRMVGFYLDEHDEETVEPLFHGVTLKELMKTVTA